jgi:hypothetical protein
MHGRRAVEREAVVDVATSGTQDASREPRPQVALLAPVRKQGNMVRLGNDPKRHVEEAPHDARAR